jgi:hypothetical protein
VEHRARGQPDGGDVEFPEARCVETRKEVLDEDVP